MGYSPWRHKESNMTHTYTHNNTNIIVSSRINSLIILSQNVSDSHLRPLILLSRVITLPTKVRLVKVIVFPVVMYGCESWTVKKAEH